MGYIGAGISRFNTADELTVTGDAEFNGNANFGDSDKAQFGAGNDLQIYHDGSNSYIDDAGAGDLFIRASNNHYLRFMNGDYAITTSEDGDVGLRYDNSQKLVTTSSGVDVTGTVTATTFQANAGGTFTTASGNDLNIVYPDSRSLFIKEGSTTHVTVNNVGNVGISNTAPDFNLSVGNSSSVNPSIQIMSATNSNAQLLFGDGAGAAGYRGTIVYGNATDSMSFSTAGAERMRIASGGNVGIGTSSPGKLMHLYAASDAASLRLENTANSKVWEITPANPGVANSGLSIYNVTDDAVALHVDNSNNVGIGTASPTSSSGGKVLAIETTADEHTNLVFNTANTGRNGIIEGRRTGRSGTERFAQINIQNNSDGGEIRFYTAGSGSDVSERARFDDSANFLVGATSLNDTNGFTVFPTGSGSSTMVRIDRNSNGSALQFRQGQSAIGTVTTTTSGVTYNTTSDIRLKQDIEPLAATDKLMAMNPVSYSWKADPDGPRSMGFIAQEMQELMPEAVSTGEDDDAMMSMDYGRITPILVSALQDAHRKIDELAAEIAELKAS
jgi:hypothetical protein